MNRSRKLLRWKELEIKENGGVFSRAVSWQGACQLIPSHIVPWHTMTGILAAEHRGTMTHALFR